MTIRKSWQQLQYEQFGVWRCGCEKINMTGPGSKCSGCGRRMPLETQTYFPNAKISYKHDWERK